MRRLSVPGMIKTLRNSWKERVPKRTQQGDKPYKKIYKDPD